MQQDKQLEELLDLLQEVEAQAEVENSQNPVVIDGTQVNCTTIQIAYDSIASGQSGTVKVKAGDQSPADLIFDRAVILTLEGGYDHIFSNIIGITSFYGSLTIKEGSVTISNLVIK